MKFFNFLKKKSAEDLESVLKRAALQPDFRDDFFERLLKEKLFVITKGGQLTEGIYRAQEDTEVNVDTFDDGRIPIFTSTDRIFDKHVIKSQVTFLEMNGKELFITLRGKTLLLNPYSDYGKEFLPQEIDRLLVNAGV